MKHVHLIGIGGTGLSAIARVLLEQGYTVSGSDRSLSPLAVDLINAGAQVFAGHAAGNIAGADRVVRSSAVTLDNPEVQAALAAGIPVLKRSEFLGQLLAGRGVIAVAGTHGKTTTTSMIAWMLTCLGMRPGFIIGSVSKNLKTNACAGSGELFVIEADEYDNMFLGLTPQLSVVTMLEHDHPDCFPTMAIYRAAFEQFIARLVPGGELLAGTDNAEAAVLMAKIPTGCQAWGYGTGSADYSAANLRPNLNGGVSFTALFQGKILADVHLQVPGDHNARNALAALAAAHRLQLPVEAAARALGEFQGAGRRFDLQGVVNGVSVIDDYAHHPTEIRATLAAARQRYPQARIWAVWQPHTYSRTQTLFSEFANAFVDADQVIVTEVYAARETSDGFSAEQLVQHMPHPGARFLAGLEEASDYLLQHVQSNDVVLVLSAGDADRISARLLKDLNQGGA